MDDGTDSEQNDIPRRVSALETEVRRLDERVRGSEQDAAAARVLAGGADRDAHDVRAEMREFRQATTASFNAMREDLVDLRGHVDRGFEAVDRGFAEVHGRLDVAATGQQHIVDLLTTLIDQPDDRTGDA